MGLESLPAWVRINGKKEALNKMSDQEFELLDQLYFVTSLSKLEEVLDQSSHELWPVLMALVQKGWVKVMKDKSDEEVTGDDIQINNKDTYVFLATKKGLMAHNTR